MGHYLIRRLLLIIPTLLIVTILAAGMIRIVPGDAVLAKVAESGNAANLDKIREELGLHVSFPQQLLTFFIGLVTGDPGDSLYSSRPVAKEFVRALPVTLELGAIGILLSVIIAIPLGVISAVKAETITDHFARIFSIIGLATPDFWIATVLVVYLSLYFGYLPPIGYRSFFSDPMANISQMYLPALILGLRLAGVSIRMMRSTMLDVLNQDYMRTARAKGLAPLHVISRHAMKNALIPVVTIIGTQVAFVFGGSVILESIFGLPGVGRLTFTAIQQRDYPQIQFNVVALATLLLATNLVVDLVYAYLDPRIRYS